MARVTDPNATPPWAKLIFGCALVFAAVLWLPALRKFDGDAKRLLDDLLEQSKKVGGEPAGPPSTVPPTTVPPRRFVDERYGEAQRRIDAGLIYVGRAQQALWRWGREVEPLLESDAGRLIATHPHLSSRFATLYFGHRPSTADLDRLAATLRRHGDMPKEALADALDAVRTLERRAEGLAAEVEAALSEVATLRRRSEQGGLYACVTLRQVLGNPWLVRRACGPLPRPGAYPPPWVWW